MLGRAIRITFNMGVDIEHRKLVQECERILVEFMKHRAKDAPLTSRANTDGRPGGRSLNRDGGDGDMSIEEGSSSGGLDESPRSIAGSNEDPDEHTKAWSSAVQASSRLVWIFAFSGVYSFARELVQCGMFNGHCELTVVEGSLGVGATPNFEADFDFEDFGVSDTRYPLTELSAASIRSSLTLGSGPNENGIVEREHEPWEYVLSGRTIWHDFLFKWWRIDPRREWRQYEHVRWRQRWSPARWTYESYDPASERPRLARLSGLAEPASSLAWEIAKVLIRAGADLSGQVCFTAWPCSQLLDTDEESEEHESDCEYYRMHTMDACQELDIVEILQALVPDSALEELQALVGEFSSAIET